MWRLQWQSFELAGVAPRLLRSDSAGPASPGAHAPASGGDKVLLPPDVLDQLTRASPDGIDSPLTFQVSPSYTSTRAFCGVLEFTSPPGVVTLPPAVIDALGLSLEDQLNPSKLLSIRTVVLPRATSVRLQPLTADFWGIADQQSALEYTLRSRFTALAANQLVTMRYGSKSYQILVLEVEPASAPAALIINTDCAVQIEPPLGGSLLSRAASSSLSATGGGGEVAGGDSAPRTLSLGGGSVSGVVRKGQHAVFAVVVPDGSLLAENDLLIHVERLAGGGAAPAAALPVAGPAHATEAFSLVGSRASVAAVPTKSAAPALPLEADVYVDAAPQKHPSLLCHRWHWNGAGASGTVRVSEEEPQSEGATASAAASARTYYVGVTTLSGDGAAPFELRAALAPKAAAALAPPTSQPDGAASLSPDDVLCDTCGAAVPRARYDLHSAVCARNNTRCTFPGCGAILRKTAAAAKEHWHCRDCGIAMREEEGAKHAALLHADIACPNNCGVMLRLEPMRAHVESACPNRRVVCRFCNAEMRGASVREHESYCGSRTAACGFCGQKLLLRDNEPHFRLQHPGVDVLPPSRELEAYLALPPPRRGSSSVGEDDSMDTGPAAAASDNAEAWSCTACTYQNAAGTARCNVCGGPRAQGRQQPPRQSASTQPPQPCRNAVCKNHASTSGTAAELALCSGCYASFAEEAPDHEELVTSLWRRYEQQLKRGCGNRACTNQYCATFRASRPAAAVPAAPTTPTADAPAPPALTRAPSTSGDLAQLLSFASLPGHEAQYYVCLPYPPSSGAGDAAARGSAAPPPAASTIAGSTAAASRAAAERRAAASRIARANF